VGTGYRQVFEVRRGNSADERLKIAKAFATEERLASLKKEIQTRLPSTTDQQLSRMGLLWNDTRSVRSDGTPERTITVTLVLEHTEGLNGPEVMRLASEIIERDLNGPSNT
jgi:hypothetical protein